MSASNMNERIRELAEQCRWQEIVIEDGEEWIHAHFLEEKFAELIVRECMENFTKVWYEQGVDVRGADIHKFMKRFEKHFGVEE